MAERLFLPMSRASTTRPRTAGRGWMRPWALRGSGTSARASASDGGGMADLRDGETTAATYPNPDNLPTPNGERPWVETPHGLPPVGLMTAPLTTDHSPVSGATDQA